MFVVSTALAFAAGTVPTPQRPRLVARPISESANDMKLSSDGNRVHFQIQGHEGPQTYIFGYDTGHGKNRQFRLEERFPDGTVKGHYGYYDSRGKLREVRYVARPFEGYEERHHESIRLKDQ